MSKTWIIWSEKGPSDTPVSEETARKIVEEKQAEGNRAYHAVSSDGTSVIDPLSEHYLEKR